MLRLVPGKRDDIISPLQPIPFDRHDMRSQRSLGYSKFTAANGERACF